MFTQMGDTRLPLLYLGIHEDEVPLDAASG
jgi:hypothetical protein